MADLIDCWASADADERAAILAHMDDATVATLLHDPFIPRPDQQAPPGDWRVWLILAGRGWGKTKTCAEDVGHYGMTHPGSRIAIVASTYADGRDTCVEGDSGLLSVLHPSCIARWNRSLGELLLTNGSRYKLYSAEKPSRMRGPQYHRAWCDELAAWTKAQEAWDMLMMGLRLGDNPQCVVATTPRPTEIIKRLKNDPTTYLTSGRTYDNLDNLAPAFIRQILAKYEGTRLGRQELEAQILDDNPDALWKRDEMIERHRASDMPPLARVVVGVDPAVTAGASSNETGIIVAGLGQDGCGYILQDCSLKDTPERWASEAVAAYHRHHADRIIGETNQGGDLIEAMLRSVSANVAYKSVRASRGKVARAEPVAALYEQGRVKHVGILRELEDQLCNWTPGEPSPDRMDALVWCLTELFRLDETRIAPRAHSLDDPPEERAEARRIIEITPRADWGEDDAMDW